MHTNQTLLCPIDAINVGQAKGFTVRGLRLIVVRQEHTVLAYENRCPHRGIPLEWIADEFLDESGSLLQCATHGALFLIESGECVAGPCSGKALRSLAVEMHNGSIWLQSPPGCDD